jgi:hypothetical protein
MPVNRFGIDAHSIASVELLPCGPANACTLDSVAIKHDASLR